MARSVKYRRTCSDAVSWRQDQALNSTMYILRMYGPTGFLLKEEGEAKDLKVYIGDPHSCTCSVFHKEKDICKHISWLLLKKYKISRNDPATWQLGLVEREIQEILYKATASSAAASRAPRQARDGNEVAAGGTQPGTGASGDGSGRPVLEQREIGPDDVCPVCQDGLLARHEPVTFCKYGCANSIHIKCMKIWADHQTSQGESSISCPFCREDFGSFALLKEQLRNTEKHAVQPRPAVHDGTTCRGCRAAPISGRCYRCASCTDYYLCQACLNKPIHQEHVSFEYRQTPAKRWRPAERNILGGSALPAAIANQLMSRPITDQDYETLLQLDMPAQAAASVATEQVVNSLPLEKVRPGSNLLAAGEQCRVCLRAYQVEQKVRRLPCRHKFHKDCIDSWLLHQRSTCPVDGMSVLGYSAAEDPDTASTAARAKLAGQGLPASSAAACNNEAAAAATGGLDLLSGILTVNGSAASSPAQPQALSLSSSGVPGSGLPPAGRAQRGRSKGASIMRPSRQVARSAPTASIGVSSPAGNGTTLPLSSLLAAGGLGSRNMPAGDAELHNQTEAIGRRAREVVRRGQRTVESNLLRSRSYSAERRLAPGQPPSLERRASIEEIQATQTFSSHGIQQPSDQTRGHQWQQQRPLLQSQRLRPQQQRSPASGTTSTAGSRGAARNLIHNDLGHSSTSAESIVLTVGSGSSVQATPSSRGQLRKPPSHRLLATNLLPAAAAATADVVPSYSGFGALQLAGSAVTAATSARVL